MIENLRREAIDLLAKAERNVLDSRELVHWATEALLAGYDTPATVTLASLNLDSSARVIDTMPVFRTALEQLGIALPFTSEEILRLLGREIAGQISVGSLQPSEGVARMERAVVSPLDHPQDLMAWCYLSSNLHPETLVHLTGSKWTECVLELARKFCSASS